MKLKIISLLLILSLLVVSCSSTGYFGKTSNSVAKQEMKITQLDGRISDLQITKINNISQLSFGVDKALERITNAPIEVVVAKELNTRVEAIAGSPPLEQQKEMLVMISNLISNNIVGQQELKSKDREITGLQEEETYLVKSKDTQIDKLSELSNAVALQADTTKSELDKYTSYWGLGGILLGIKSLALHLMWTVIILGVIFIVLRIAAASNPIANLCFGIFQQLAGIVIGMIEKLIPASIAVVAQAHADAGKVLTVIDQVATTINPPSTTVITPISSLVVTLPTTSSINN